MKMEQPSTTDVDNKSTAKTEPKDYLYRMSKYDGLLISIILILSASWLLHFGRHASGIGGNALVYENGKLIEKIDVKKDKTISLSLEKGKMDIEVKEGQIRISNSSCPHKICVNTGWISEPGRTIICVPNKVLVEMKGKPDPGYHAQTY